LLPAPSTKVEAISKMRADAQTAPGRVRRSEQYSLAKILGIWALAAAPMGILSWIAFPLVAPDFDSDPLAFGVTRVVLLTLGLVWLFVLSMIIFVKRKVICAGRQSSGGSG
jgi:hypothetical protein